MVVPPDDTGALVSQLGTLKEDETVLVVGHSNTTPLIERLSGKIAPITDSEYDRLIVVVTNHSGNPKVATLRYGKSTQ